VKILVTGINGFVGSYLRQTLAERGHEVFGIDIKSNDAAVLSVDLMNQQVVSETVLSINPDAIIHLAAISQVDFKNPGIIYNVNVTGTANLLTACAGLSHPVKFLFISSSQVYGNVPENELPITEDFPIAPVNHYGASKAAGEMLVRAFGCEYGLQYMIFRPFNHTGPKQTINFVVPKIVAAFKEKKSTIELGNINTIRDFSDVRDVVKGYVSAMENFQNTSIFNISSGKGISIRGVVDLLKEITGRDIDIDEKVFLKRLNDIASVIGDNTRIKSELMWKEQFGIRETLQDMLKS
jgi:nucleoside-diphosphate-sugar epimerase